MSHQGNLLPRMFPGYLINGLIGPVPEFLPGFSAAEPEFDSIMD